MSFPSRFFLASCTVLALAASGGCATAPVASDPMTVTATLHMIPATPGCGIMFVGTPLSFQVTSGPKEVEGKRITALVPCIESHKDFYVTGLSYELRITRKNVYELPVPLPDHLSFYLIDATNVYTRKKAGRGIKPH